MNRQLFSIFRRGVSTVTVRGKQYRTDEWTNVPQTILLLTDRKLHLDENHPIGILRNLIEKRFDGLGYTYYNHFEPVVSTYENFDVLEFPKDHPGRSKSDTYYLNETTLLRTHTSAHELECFQNCKTPGYFISADVYRRDEIDRTHYPAFHQMEGARIWQRGDKFESQILKDISEIPKVDLIVSDPDPPFHETRNPKQPHLSPRETELVSIHLKRTVELMVNEVFNEGKKAALAAGNVEEELFKEPLKIRWVELYFPWTAPSWEIEVWWKGEWLECCGCGLVREQVLTNSGVQNHVGWAFGLGLDRIAMMLFGIPDIRLFWTLDERFKTQFQQGKITTFKPYSKYPGTVRDIAYWLPEGKIVLHENDLMEIVRDVAGDIVESVKLIDEFVHPKTGKKSQCYRINYQSMDRSLTNEEINIFQDQIRDLLTDNFNIELR